MKLLALATAAGLVVAGLSGCGSYTSACVDWVDFVTPADAAADAQYVLVGSVVGSAPNRHLFYLPAPVHRFVVDEVLKGDLSAGDEIEVASVPQTCNGEAGAFPEGDPLETDQRVEIFLFEEDGEFRLITPFDGVELAPEGEALPWEPLDD